MLTECMLSAVVEMLVDEACYMRKFLVVLERPPTALTGDELAAGTA